MPALVAALSREIWRKISVAWTPPAYTRGQVDAAGRVLAGDPIWIAERERALEVMSNWRSAHAFPLNTFQVTLRRRAQAVDKDALVSQRLKRLSSIERKLKAHGNMQLSRMHDIGGCRAIVRNIRVFDELVAKYTSSRAKNPKRANFVKAYDYIAKPKDDGYRGIHLVYRYVSPLPAHAVYNGLRIEIQLRTSRQHAWATAVETADLFTGQALKWRQGTPGWKRFFQLMGTAIALRERRPPVAGTPSSRAELRDELRDLCHGLRVEATISSWRGVVQYLSRRTKQAYAFLLQLDTNAMRVEVREFQLEEMPLASEEYLRLEKNDRPELQTVLVRVDSISALRGAFPNYYMDATAFLEEVHHAAQ